MMKRVILYFMVALFSFQLFVCKTNALASEEVKNEIQDYATELGNLKFNLTTQLRNFDEWSTNYSSSLKVFMKRDISKTIADAIVDENYRLAFDTIENHLRLENKIDAANAFHTIKEGLLDAIDQSIDYERRLTSFLNENTDSILVADMLPLIDEVRATYNSVRTPLISILDTYYYGYYDDAKRKLEDYASMSVTELDQLFDDLKNDLYVYTDYANILNNKVNSYKQLLKDLNLDGMGFEELLYDDIKPYITKTENLISDIYYDFVEKEWEQLKEEGQLIVNDTSKTIAQRNQILINKMNLYTQLKEKASSNFEELKNSISINRILEKVKKLENKTITECNNAIEYVRSLLLVEDFDLILQDGVTDDQVILNRDSHFLIIQNEYDLNTFLAFLKVKNENVGELKSLNIYDGTKVGTKSEIGIYQGEEEKVLYYVILKGDFRANGVIDISDITYLIKSILNHSELNEIERIAGDMNNDNLLDISDITATIKKALSN